MPDRTTTAPRRAAAVVGLTALAVALIGSPALAQDVPLPQLETVTGPVVDLLSPSPSPSPSAAPLPVPVPEPLAPVVEPVVESVGGGTHEEEPVAQQGSAPRPVVATAPGTTVRAAAAPGTGSASLGALRGVGDLRAGTGTADVPALGAPMIAAAPRLALPGLRVPETAPVAEVAGSRPSSTPGAPAGLPALVVAVAAVVLVAAGAGHVAEVRVRRAAAATD